MSFFAGAGARLGQVHATSHARRTVGRLGRVRLRLSEGGQRREVT